MKWSVIILLVITNGALQSPVSCADEAPLIFETHVRPVVRSKCGKCHSATVQKGGLNLASMAGILTGGESGEPAVADSLEESLMWAMIEGGAMPPEDQPQLSVNEQDVIRTWIANGARSHSARVVEERQLTQHDVLPILLLRCAACHGAQVQKGGFDIRTSDSLRTGGNSGPGLIAGEPDNSRLIHRIETQACPPRELMLKFFVKRPSQSEVQKLRDWISVGAPDGDVTPDVATTEPDRLVTDEDRLHWAFQPLRRDFSASNVDGFIRRRLAEKQLDLSIEADRDTKIRRTYFNLIGLPPSIEEWQTWHHHPASDWHSQLVDHLLASERYGERWGRYWLDLAGYADSEGGVSADPVRAVAWKYRDYVINAFNNDKPYDRFLLEQIAGDELVDYSTASEVTEEIVQNLIATGFLRMGIDQTGSRTMNFVPERLGVISDAITIVSEGLMGLTMGCARCHSHKYDAIPHRDYYRFKAILKGALDEHDWLSFKTRTLRVDTPERVARVKATNPPLETELRKHGGQLSKAVAHWHLELLRAHAPELSESERNETIRALRIADNNRTQPQRRLVEKLQTAQTIPDARQPKSVQQAQQAIDQLQDDIKHLRRQLEAPIAIRALWDRAAPSPTYVLRRGEHDKPGPLVGPGVPSVLTDGRTPFNIAPPFPNGSPKTGRRLAFARWLTDENRALTARVMVNRIWYHHFGVGLVSSVENFGAKGERPSHPELLDWLAQQFIDHGWSIKHVHRMIMKSRTFRQSSLVTAAAAEHDPTNRRYSRMPMRRLNAEALRDSLLTVAGKLNLRGGGPPDTVTVDRSGLVSVDQTADRRWRRSVYLQYRRTEIPSVMAAFDYPEMGPNCLTRSTSTVSPQALMLMNGAHVRNLSAHFAARIRQLTHGAGDGGAIIDSVYAAAFSRQPTVHERQLGLDSLNELTAAWNGDTNAALETYCHTILNSAAFIYVD